MQGKTLIIPGSFALVSGYKGFKGIDIWKSGPAPRIDDAEWIIAHSLGANYLFSHSISDKQKVILINPLIKRRGIASLIFRDIQFFLKEGAKDVERVSLGHWPHALALCFKLLSVNVYEGIKKLPRENVYVIKGVMDTYFCDSEDAELARKNGNTVYEVVAAHNWNENIDKKVREIISST